MSSLSEARERMEEKGTVGAFTKSAHRAGESMGKHVQKELHSKSATQRKRANFARMARRGFKPLKKNRGKSSGK